jgi:hypothetical protein
MKGSCYTTTMIKDVEEFAATIFKLVVSVGIVGVLLCLAASGDWPLFATAAPLAIFLVPGYLDLLPHSAKRHPVSCDCAELDAKCEWGFWCQYSQKGLLIFPVFISMIIINGYFTHGLATAIANASKAAFFIIVFSLITAVGLFAWCKRNKT